MFHDSVSWWGGSRAVTALALSSCLLLLGCPQLLSDDFERAIGPSSADAESAAPANDGLGNDDPIVLLGTVSSAGNGSVGDAGCEAPATHTCDSECRECCTDADCPSTDVCLSGSCAPACDAPLTACPAQCVNLASDPDNCGECGNRCGRGRDCVSGVCNPSWVELPAVADGFVARERATSANMDGKLFIWGGVDASGSALQTGAIYDLSDDSWTSVAIDANTPSARVGAVAVWTGAEVFVWGGGDTSNSADYADGARYNPALHTWQPISPSNAPSARRASTIFWTGTQVLLWSGITRNFDAADSSNAYTYDPGTELWRASLAGSAPPSDLFAPTVGWSGNALYVFGGDTSGDESDAFFEYRPDSNRWSTLQSGPSARQAAFGTWDGSGLLVWGGVHDGALVSDGQRWIPDTANVNGGAWSPLLPNDAFVRQVSFRQTGWSAAIAPGKTLLMGGDDLISGAHSDGTLYDSATNTWTGVFAGPSDALHVFGTGAWTGDEFVLWGGRATSASAPSSLGERFRP